MSGVDKKVVSKRVVLADVPPERKPERGYIQMFPRNEKPERGYVRQNHPFTKPPFYLPVQIKNRIAEMIFRILFRNPSRGESLLCRSRPVILPTMTQWPDCLLDSKAGKRRLIIPAWTAWTNNARPTPFSGCGLSPRGGAMHVTKRLALAICNAICI